MRSAIVIGTVTFLQPALAQAASYSYSEPAWSPYLVGALIGCLVLVTLATAGKKVGASSAYADTSGLLARLLAPRHAASLPYYRDNRPKIGWTLVFVGGALLGSLLAAWSGGEMTGTFLQDIWVTRFGTDSHALRIATALGGGALVAFGARVGGGCTSGHGISGTLQLSVGSWIAVICFFVGGVATASILYLM